jgi:hypothetical protein
MLGQTTHIVMGLDHMRLARFDADLPNDVGIDGALGEEGNPFQLARLLV